MAVSVVAIDVVVVVVIVVVVTAGAVGSSSSSTSSEERMAASSGSAPDTCVAFVTTIVQSVFGNTLRLVGVGSASGRFSGSAGETTSLNRSTERVTVETVEAFGQRAKVATEISD